MEIMLVGGPYDGEWVNVDGDNWNPPMPYLNMHPKLEPLAKPLLNDVNPKATIDLLRYRLERVDTSNHRWHYEYHYQGR
jgi:hypothetical protein